MTTLAQPRPRTAPGVAFGQLVRNEARLAWRQPTGLIGGLALPTVLLIIFSLIPTFRQPQASLGGFSPLDLYVPILIGFSLAMLALFGLPIPLVSYRELGVLRRLSTTPVPPSWLLAAQGVVQLGVAMAGLAGILVAGAALGTPAPKSPGGFALAVVLCVAGLFPLGLLIAAVARTASGASVIGRLVLIPMLFFAGLWWPRELMPAVLRDVSDYIPLGAAVEAIQDSMRGPFPPAAPLLVLTGYAVLFGFLAMRFFRWE
jgi:ABC-2 type transport system permease protein